MTKYPYTFNDLLHYPSTCETLRAHKAEDNMGKCKCANCGVMFTDDDYEPGDELKPLVCDDCYLLIDATGIALADVDERQMTMN